MEQKIVYLPDMAKLLGRSRDSIRNYVRRRDWTAVPEPGRIGRRLAWHIDDVTTWIDSKFGEDKKRGQRGPGRPKKQPTSVAKK